jgi:aminoglycoside 3'-phosphotransferase I
MPFIHIVALWRRTYSEWMLAKGQDTTNALTAGFVATPVTIGESGCTTWRLDAPDDQLRAYLKHGLGPLADAIADEMVRLRWMQVHLPVPQIIQFVADAKESWLVTEAIPGKSARQYLEERQVSEDAIIDALASFMRRVHALPQDQCPYDARLPRRLIDARARIDAGAINIEDFDEERQGWSAEDVWTALQLSRPQSLDIVFTHGDFSLDNILLDGANVTGCIDVGGAGLADRYQDIAICWSDLAEYGVDAQARFLEQYGVGDGDRGKLAFYQMLNELF